MRQGERRETALLFTGSAQVSINVRNGRHPINCDFSGGLPGDVELLPEEQAITAVSEASRGEYAAVPEAGGQQPGPHGLRPLFRRGAALLLPFDG